MPPIHDECLELFMSKSSFYKSGVRVLAMVLTLIAATLGVLITCNTKLTADMTSYRDAVIEIRAEQDQTRVYIDRLSETVTSQGKVLASLETTSLQTSKSVDRLESKIDRILVEVRNHD